jgi:hypothetical protein
MSQVYCADRTNNSSGISALGRSSSEAYIDKGPDIDEPEKSRRRPRKIHRYRSISFKEGERTERDDAPSTFGSFNLRSAPSPVPPSPLAAIHESHGPDIDQPEKSRRRPRRIHRYLSISFKEGVVHFTRDQQKGQRETMLPLLSVHLT